MSIYALLTDNMILPYCKEHTLYSTVSSYFMFNLLLLFYKEYTLCSTIVLCFHGFDALTSVFASCSWLIRGSRTIDHSGRWLIGWLTPLTRFWLFAFSTPVDYMHLLWFSADVYVITNSNLESAMVSRSRLERGDLN